MSAFANVLHELRSEKPKVPPIPMQARGYPSMCVNRTSESGAQSAVNCRNE
jgi:hypothetical protein